MTSRAGWLTVAAVLYVCVYGMVYEQLQESAIGMVTVSPTTPRVWINDGYTVMMIGELIRDNQRKERNGCVLGWSEAGNV